MFTGIVEKTANILSWSEDRLLIDNILSQNHDLKLGQSIAINGCCLTLVSMSDQKLHFDVSSETQTLTHFGHLQKNSLETYPQVNVELAMSASDLFDGHMVSGHVDVCAKVFKVAERDANEISNAAWTDSKNNDVQSEHKTYKDIDILISKEALGNNVIIHKGSITVHGVSLTVNKVSTVEQGTLVSLHIIPHTLEVTNLDQLKAGDPVNIEFDMMGKYIQKYMQQYQATVEQTS